MDTLYPPRWRLQDRIDLFKDKKLEEIEAIENNLSLSSDEKQCQIELVLKQAEQALDDKDYEEFYQMVNGEASN